MKQDETKGNGIAEGTPSVRASLLITGGHLRAVPRDGDARARAVLSAMPGDPEEELEEDEVVTDELLAGDVEDDLEDNVPDDLADDLANDLEDDELDELDDDDEIEDEFEEAIEEEMEEENAEPQDEKTDGEAGPSRLARKVR